MDEPVGRREANKRAVRDAITQAAQRLFATQGFEATSVRQIADAAGVAERTFYRYFEGKEGLIARDAQHRMDILHAAIAHRPPEERPFTAVRRAMIALAELATTDPEARPIWLFSDQPRPWELLQKSAPRPLLRFEEAITRALLARSQPPPAATAALIARVAIAVLRSVAIAHREAETAGEVPPAIPDLLARAFADLSAMLAEE
jgi:AcrR family transcriptional regulator